VLSFGDSSDEELDGTLAASDEEDGPETDPQRLLQRQKQVDFGKNTIGYERYVQAVPRSAPVEHGC